MTRDCFWMVGVNTFSFNKTGKKQLQKVFGIGLVEELKGTTVELTLTLWRKTTVVGYRVFTSFRLVVWILTQVKDLFGNFNPWIARVPLLSSLFLFLSIIYLQVWEIIFEFKQFWDVRRRESLLERKARRFLLVKLRFGFAVLGGLTFLVVSRVFSIIVHWNVGVPDTEYLTLVQLDHDVEIIGILFRKSKQRLESFKF